MEISINNNFRTLYNTSTPIHNNYFIGNRIAFANDLRCDKFEKSENTMTAPVFAGKKTNRKESKKIEETLKNIDGLHDPYSDVIMISQKKFRHLQGKIQKRSSAESMNNLMNGYTEHMFPSETEVFNLLRHAVHDAKKNGTANGLTYTDILQENLPIAKARLINNQFNVTDNIRDYAQKNLTKDEQKCVGRYLEIINNDICNDQFRIKKSIEMLRGLYNDIPDKAAVDHIIKLSHDFPNTATSADAFIVKYADKTQEEIAELLVSPSQISIEHIKPSSERGESKGANYLAASKRMNNYRSSTPLDEMIERYPNIPKQTQRYMDELISKINRGGLSDIALTLPDVRESLYNESKGLIDVNISKLNPQITEKVEHHKTKLQELIEHFKQKED